MTARRATAAAHQEAPAPVRRWPRPPRPRSTVDVLAFAERSVYFLAAVALIAAAAALFAVLVIDVLSGRTGDTTQTVVTVLERMLLVFILLELGHSVLVVLRERTLVAEPFLVIGLIAVVRRILIITAEGERFTGEQFTNLMLELGILTALVIALATALYFLRTHQRTAVVPQAAPPATGGKLSAPVAARAP